MRRKKQSRRTFGRRKKSPETVFWTVFIILLVLGGAAFFAYKFFILPPLRAAAPVAEVETESLEEVSGEFPLWVPKEPLTHTNILLLGLDDHGMSDVVMVISYDMESFKSVLLSLKRDTFVPGQTWAKKDSGQDHLAWANNRGMGQEKDYHAGANLAAYTVEDLLGIDIHAYASITFEGFTKMVDLIGGVELDISPAFEEISASGLKAGWQKLNGKQALFYSRHRQNPRIPEPGAEDQAADRVIRNQRLLKALLMQAKNLSGDEMLGIVEDLDENLCTSMDDWTILELANVLYNAGPDEMKTILLPGHGELAYQSRIDNATYYYYLDFEACDSILQEWGLK